MTFIDTHVHFWDRSKIESTWLDPLTTINAIHVPETLHAEAGAEFPEKIVFVQAGSNGSQGYLEAEWVSSLAAREPRVAGIVAYRS
jgi:L-fuconolactonase